MVEKFVKYRTFNDKTLAAELCELLAKHDIPFATESTEGFFDASFVQNEILNLYYVKLLPGDFDRADQLLIDHINAEDPQPVGDYYLFSFSNDELFEVLTKPDEWNEFDLYWARKMLKSRGVTVNENEINNARKEHAQELKKPWRLERYWVLLPIILCVIAFFFYHVLAAGGLVFLGCYIVFGKKTMPDGQRVMAFSDSDRRIGMVVLVAGIIATIAVFVFVGRYTFFDRPL